VAAFAANLGEAFGPYLLVAPKDTCTAAAWPGRHTGHKRITWCALP